MSLLKASKTMEDEMFLVGLRSAMDKYSSLKVVNGTVKVLAKDVAGSESYKLSRSKALKVPKAA